jgi:UDP-glucose 4-epimerase
MFVFENLLDGSVPRINGDDYATPDGTNVRDYVHVADIAAAHAVAARRLIAGEPLEPAYNLGSRHGLSVREVMDAVARVTGIRFTPEVGPRRAGDPDRIVATGELAARDLDWRMRHSVDEMVRSGWDAQPARILILDRRRAPWRTSPSGGRTPPTSTCTTPTRATGSRSC